MKKIVQFNISKEDGFYTAEGVGLAIVTQGKTLDETVSNIQEALELHLEGEDLAELGIDPNPSTFVNFELDAIHA